MTSTHRRPVRPGEVWRASVWAVAAGPMIGMASSVTGVATSVIIGRARFEVGSGVPSGTVAR